MAADLGQLDCLRVIQAHGIMLDGSVSCCAAKANQLPCLELALEFKDRWSAVMIYESALRGMQLRNYVT
jgi:Mlc titration factor MtfA (ptsG expression regulator)